MSFVTKEFFLLMSIILVCLLILQTKWIYKLLKNKVNVVKEIILFIASYVFYGYWDWRFCFLLLFMTVVAYVTALNCKNKIAYTVGICVPIGVLMIFKYFNFFVDSFMALAGHKFDALNIILPVGISFYTFQALSYVIDVKRNKLEVERDFLKLAVYIAFFPQLVAGPIVKAADFLPQLREDRKVTWKRFQEGVCIFVFGCVKKVIFADWLSVFVDDVFYAPKAYNWLTIILAVFSYSIQIYFDFSGYSDMAVGCARIMGYDFNKNFNVPYLSENVTEFWRRWHISLSTWLKEYVYIPLGGNRKGKVRQYINLFATMLIGGLWLGAIWPFVVWGGMHGLALCLDKIIMRYIKNNVSTLHKIFRVMCVNIFVSFCWIFFRADTFTKAGEIIKGIFTLQNGVSQPYIWSIVAIVVVIIAYIVAILKSSDKPSVDGDYILLDFNKWVHLVILFVIIGLILGLGYTGQAPFVYFQF